mgnify:FL=1|jgi:uncharacterized membrane protein
MQISELSAEQTTEIQEAIRCAEEHTSGEIRVHIDQKCAGDPVKRAIKVFKKLKMDATEQRNGVLLYLSFSDRKLAIIGDEGINQLVPVDFWDSTKEQMILDFRNGEFTQGIVKAIGSAGKQLGQYFPLLENDENELSNEVTFN